MRLTGFFITSSVHVRQRLQQRKVREAWPANLPLRNISTLGGMHFDFTAR